MLKNKLTFSTDLWQQPRLEAGLQKLGGEIQSVVDSYKFSFRANKLEPYI